MWGRALHRPDERVPAAPDAGDHMLMRAGLIVVAILVALILGRLTVQEPPPRIQKVKETAGLMCPPLRCPRGE